MTATIGIKKILFFILVLISFRFSAQTDTTTRYLDSLSADQLQQYYIDLPEPVQFYKGPVVGDSLFQELIPLTVPTKTVDGEPLHLNRNIEQENDAEQADTSTAGAQRMKPKITLGTGKLAYHGDLYKNHFRSPSTGRQAFDLGISQRLTRFLQLDFSVMFGTLGGNAWLDRRH